MRKIKPTDGRYITGIVIANEWDAHGNVTGVAIYADNEKIFQVCKNECLQDLLKAIQKKARIEGETVKLSDGHERIEVKSVQVLKTSRKSASRS